jgi:hypothetical protein
MDVSDFYGEIGRKLGDPNNERWSQAVILERLNRSQARVQALTNAVKTKETLTPVSGTAEVSVDSDVMDIIRVHIKNSSGEWKPLEGILMDQLDFKFPNWQQMDDGEPLAWTWDGTNQQLTLIPAPNDSWAVADGLRVWEIQKPADMDDSADVPFSSNAAMIPYHPALIHDVVAECWQDDATPEAIGKAKFHRSNDFSRPGEFEKEIKLIRAKFDAPQAIPASILWRPQGGRASKNGVRSKGNPLNQ